MVEIKIGEKTYSKISEILEDYTATQKRVNELKTEIKKFKIHLKQLTKFLKENNILLPGESKNP